MTKTILLSLLALSACRSLLAQFPVLDEYVVSPATSVQFPVSTSSGKGKNKAEIPPWIVPGGLRSYFFVDGSGTYIWSSSSSLVHDKSIDLNNAVGPALASASYIQTPNYHPSVKTNNWKRNYHAIYSAAYLDHAVEGAVTLGFLHGENKNQVVGHANGPFARLYQNTIQENVTINPADHSTYSGGEPFVEGWNAYNATISAAWVKNNAATNWGQQFFHNELGPIAWPSTGYVTVNGIKCTSGLKHPSSVVANGYVYVFFTDGGPFGNNIQAEEGRLEGVKVVRAPVDSALDAKAYRVFYRTPAGAETWLPALPDGFTKETMLDYVAVRGAKSSDVMSDSNGVSQHIRFSVAKVRNKEYFIGVEEYIDIADSKKFKVALRFSKDLVNWTDRARIVSEAPSWEETQLNYPIFLDKEGWSNTEIDIDDFYILGTGTTPQHHVNRIRLQPGALTTQLSGATPLAASRSANTELIFPNPSYGSFRFSYHIDEPSRVRISVRDLNGHNIGLLSNQLRNNGNFTETINIYHLPAGIYVVEMLTNTRRSTYKIVKH